MRGKRSGASQAAEENVSFSTVVLKRVKAIFIHTIIVHNAVLSIESFSK